MKYRKRYFQAIFIGTMILVVIVVVEAGARIIWRIKYNAWLEQQLHGYDYVDYSRGIICLTPNTRMTVTTARRGLEENRKPLGLKNLEETLEHIHATDTTLLFMINSRGFKGPEVEVPKPGNVFRIVTIGNSCTFGPSNDTLTYPRVMETMLNRYLHDNHCPMYSRIEVVNVGVIGYNYERVLKRLDEHLDLDPDLITIYLGWNQTIQRADPRKSQFMYRNLALYRIFYHFFINRHETGLQEEYGKTTVYNPDDPAVDSFRKYSFEYDIKDLDELMERISDSDTATRIAIISLAGMMDNKVRPDQRTMDLAHPLSSTNNLFVWDVLIKKYNYALKVYANEHNIIFVDFNEYAFRTLHPRSYYFVDAIHFTDEGYRILGTFLAHQLIPQITCK